MMLRPKVVEDPEFGEVVQIVDWTDTYAGYDSSDEQIQLAYHETTGGDWLRDAEYVELYRATKSFQRAIVKEARNAVGVETLKTPEGKRLLLSDERDIVAHGLQEARAIGSTEQERWTERAEGGIDDAILHSLGSDAASEIILETEFPLILLSHPEASLIKECVRRCVRAENANPAADYWSEDANLFMRADYTDLMKELEYAGVELSMHEFAELYAFAEQYADAREDESTMETAQ